MPIYEYQCESCRQRFEALVPFAHRDEVTCEECGAEDVVRLASSFNAAVPGADPVALGGGSCCGSGGCGHCG